MRREQRIIALREEKTEYCGIGSSDLLAISAVLEAAMSRIWYCGCVLAALLHGQKSRGTYIVMSDLICCLGCIMQALSSLSRPLTERESLDHGLNTRLHTKSRVKPA